MKGEKISRKEEQDEPTQLQLKDELKQALSEFSVHLDKQLIEETGLDKIIDNLKNLVEKESSCESVEYISNDDEPVIPDDPEDDSTRGDSALEASATTGSIKPSIKTWIPIPAEFRKFLKGPIPSVNEILQNPALRQYVSINYENINKLEYFKHFCKESSIKKINDLIKLSEEYVPITIDCCICLEELPSVYTKCKHSICRKCFNTIRDHKCPLCRQELKEIIINQKYALFVLGDKTNFQAFHNGGYETVGIIYYPPLNGTEVNLYHRMRFVHDDPTKRQFCEDLFTLEKSGYRLAYENPKVVKKWFNDMELFELEGYDAMIL